MRSLKDSSTFLVCRRTGVALTLRAQLRFTDTVRSASSGDHCDVVVLFVGTEGTELVDGSGLIWMSLN
jgi:hypothetical protein